MSQTSESYLDIVWKQFRKNRPAYVSLWLLVPIVLLAIFAPVVASNQPFAYWDGQQWLFPWFRALFHPPEVVDLMFNMSLLAFGPWVALSLVFNWFARRAGWAWRTRLGLVVAALGVLTLVLLAFFGMPRLYLALDSAAWPRELLTLRDGTWRDSPWSFLWKLGLVSLPLWFVLTLPALLSLQQRDFGPVVQVLSVALLAPVSALLMALGLFWCVQFDPVAGGMAPWLPNNPYQSRTFPLEEFRSQGKAYGFYPPIPFGDLEQDPESFFRPPGFMKDAKKCLETNDGFVHLLGTDDNGRDVLTRMIYGTRISITVGLLAVGLYLSIGIVVGAVAGYFGGWVDILISRIIEVVLLIPTFFLILTLVAMLGPSIYIIMFVIGITGWPTVARLIRGEFLKQRNIDYVMAARALGAPHLRVIFVHILPNAITPALVAAPFGVAGAIITEAGLSLLGFGVRPPAASWGTLLRLGNDNYSYWWLVFFPSIAIFFCVSIFNLVGSGLRDAMDPRLRV